MCTLIICSEPGRPSVNIDFDDIELLRHLNFTWCNIANILGISRSTIYRRIEEEGLQRNFTYTNISDAELDHQIKLIKNTHPNDGERLIIGHLRAHSIFVTRARTRASIHRVDPANVAIRRMVTIRRRVYFADGPNSVWHIDGHHKLNLVTHGGIDGFSRTISYLRCAGNNRSTTVLDAFMEAVECHGMPQKVRSDLGGENVEVWRYMIEHHSSDGAVIVGSSVHNERIERLWRDVFRCVCSVFYTTFKQMEEDGELDPMNATDMYCLHYVFLPRINAALDAFVQSWNNHPITTEHNLTPNQLFIKGALKQNNSGQTPHLSTSVHVPTPAGSVLVPSLSFKPCHQLEAELQLIDLLGPSQTCGWDIYSLVIRSVGRHLSGVCPNCDFD